MLGDWIVGSINWSGPLTRSWPHAAAPYSLLSDDDVAELKAAWVAALPPIRLRWCSRPLYLTEGGGWCQRRWRHPGVCCLDPETAREMDDAEFIAAFEAARTWLEEGWEQ